MSGPAVYVRPPPASLFKFPPDPRPLAIPPPSDEWRIAAPFQINPDFYQAVLKPQVPITFAICYIAIVLSLNAFNRSRKWKPWWISRTRVFTPLVVFHNLSLAVYSAITFAAMVRTVYVSMPYRDEGVTPAHYVDALCKMNGPRGLGDAIAYGTSNHTWASTNSIIKLAGDLPDSTDVGRIWNEGLAFWGWLFYMSKFYEVIDTLVILARGKRSPTLQTYHHAGAMMCMWAGIRYMSAPIWLFVYLNSLIHTLMYVYFSLATAGVKVPKHIKQTLTTMQISQFLIGIFYAGAHLFIKYDVPLTTAYTIVRPIERVVSAVSSVASSIAHDPPTITSISSAAVSVASAVASPSPSFAAVLKRLLLRAAGDEGVAENIRDSNSQIILEGVSSAHSSASSAASAATSAVVQQYETVTNYRTSITTVDCIVTSGQAFAIWLNIVYLAPLMFLFLRFFVKAYITGTLNKKPGTRRTSFTEAVNQASDDVRREADNVGQEFERRLSEQVLSDVKDMREGRYNDKNRKSATKNIPSAGKVAESAKSTANEAIAKVKEEANQLAAKAQQAKENGLASERAKGPTSSQHLKAESAIEDSQDEDGDDDEDEKSGVESSTAGLSSPEKKKKKKNKKKRKSAAAGGTDGQAQPADGAAVASTDASKAGKDGTPSFADAAKETPKTEA